MGDPTRAAPLRVGLLIDRWEPRRGGAEVALATFASWLEERGHEVLVFARSGPPAGERAPGELVLVRAGGFGRGARERRLAQALLDEAEARCDVTVGVRHLPRVDLYWPHGGAHAATLRALGKSARGRHRVFLELERAALAEGGARSVVCVSGLVQRELAELYPEAESRLRLVPDGVDLDRFRPAARAAARAALRSFGGEDAEPLLTFVGRNPRLKGLPLLLQALERLGQRSWRLLIAGPPDAEAWARRAQRHLGRPGRVHGAAHLDALALAAASDTLVLPSRRDPCGLVTLEALACGTPVVVSDAVGAGEVLSDAEQGAVFPLAEGVDSLARCLEERLDHLSSGVVDRAQIASAVADRGLDAWMSAMERELLEIADGAEST